MARHNAQGIVEQDFKGLAGSTVLHRSAEVGFDPDPNNVCGNNSGAHALNFAINNGAKTIILLGYDMKIKDRESHWHGGHGYGLRPDVYANLFIPSITSMAKVISQHKPDVKIVNASPDSDLRCFEFDNFENYIDKGE